ncbi:MAG: NAD(P)/FAD-dependent oxidoreductase, partial [Thermoplasmatota archaeon]
MEEKYDVIIIGGGPAGLSAAIYTSRADFDTLILDELDKLIEKVKSIDNYFGFPEGVSGKELLDRGRKQAERFGTDIKNERALLIKIDGENYVVETADKSYITRSLILAPGIQHKKPDLSGVEDFEGKGVSYCVT